MPAALCWRAKNRTIFKVPSSTDKPQARVHSDHLSESRSATGGLRQLIGKLYLSVRIVKLQAWTLDNK